MSYSRIFEVTNVNSTMSGQKILVEVSKAVGPVFEATMTDNMAGFCGADTVPSHVQDTCDKFSSFSSCEKPATEIIASSCSEASQALLNCAQDMFQKTLGKQDADPCHAVDLPTSVSDEIIKALIISSIFAGCLLLLVGLGVLCCKVKKCGPEATKKKVSNGNYSDEEQQLIENNSSINHSSDEDEKEPLIEKNSSSRCCGR